jgi:hypothetical protein
LEMDRKVFPGRQLEFVAIEDPFLGALGSRGQPCPQIVPKISSIVGRPTFDSRPGLRHPCSSDDRTILRRKQATLQILLHAVPIPLARLSNSTSTSRAGYRTTSRIPKLAESLAAQRVECENGHRSSFK